LPLAGGRNAADDRRPVFFTDAAARIAGLPGVRAVSMVDSLPLRGLAGGSVFSIEGRPPLPPDQRPVGLIRFVDRSYFQTMGSRCSRAADSRTPTPRSPPPVIIVNRMVARRFWPEEGDGSPIGGRISVVAANGSVAEIVGVVGDVKSERIEGEDWPTIYYPYTQVTPSSMTFVVKTADASGRLDRGGRARDPADGSPARRCPIS
jgi:hypothetical protein